MNFPEKIVTTIPLQNLWTQEGYIEAKRISYLTRNDLRELLKANSIKFVLANVGQSLKWIDATQWYHFWKSEVENHLAENI